MSKFIKRIEQQTSIKTKILEIKSLSYRAKGIYSYLMSRPDDWNYNMTNIINTSTDGKEAVQKGIKELEKVGLLRRQKTQNSQGKFIGWDWELYDNTTDELENRQSVKPSDGKAVHINNIINEKGKRKKQTQKIPILDIKENGDNVVVTYPRYWTSSKPTTRSTP